MCLFCVCAVLCLGRGLATSWSLVHGVLPIANRSGDWKAARAHKGCRAIKKWGLRYHFAACVSPLIFCYKTHKITLLSVPPPFNLLFSVRSVSYQRNDDDLFFPRTSSYKLVQTRRSVKEGCLIFVQMFNLFGGANENYNTIVSLFSVYNVCSFHCYLVSYDVKFVAYNLKFSHLVNCKR
jgi:hypothetical protein